MSEAFDLRLAVKTMPLSAKMFFGGMVLIVVLTPVAAYTVEESWVRVVYAVMGMVFAFLFGGIFNELFIQNEDSELDERGAMTEIPSHEDLTRHNNEELAEFLEEEAKWIRKESKYLQTEIGRNTPMPGSRAESIEERLRDMAEMARIIKERRREDV